MGCTSSNRSALTKEHVGLPPATFTAEDGQQLINDHFRKWLKTNRPEADEYVLNDVLLTAQPSNETEDYRTIIGKALDLLADRQDIKSTNKLGKLVQKEIVLASPKKVAHTIHVLKQTAEKLRHGHWQLESDKTPAIPEDANEDVHVTEATTTLEAKPSQVRSGEPGIGLRDALEKARILFYKGKQAAIFANPNGGYDVRILEVDDDSIHQDGNLLRSIIVTEVKLRPKGGTATKPSTSSPLFIPPPPPSTAPPPPLPPTKLLDENEINDDFRRSIDAALKGLETAYQPARMKTTSPLASEQTQAARVEKPTTTTRAASPPPLQVLQCGVTNAPFPNSISKEKTAALPAELPPPQIDRTVHLAEIMCQMAEQQKLAGEQQSAKAKANDDAMPSHADIQPKLVGLVDSMNDLLMDSIEQTTGSAIGNPMPPMPSETIESLVMIRSTDEPVGEIERIVKELKQHGEKFESRESLPALTSTKNQPSSYSLGLTSPLSSDPMIALTSTHSKAKLRSENRPKSFIANDESSSKDRYNLNKQISLDELAYLVQTGLSNPHLPTSTTKLGISTSSGKIEEEDHAPLATAEPSGKLVSSISQIIEEHHPILDHPSLSSACPAAAAAPVITPLGTHTRVKSPSHNVTYTEIIHSESRDGEQSRRFVTESYNEHPSNEDEQTTTLKVVTKSEFSNHPSLGEKIMEQSVQVITVRVRNETIKTTIQQAPSTDNALTYERRPVSELVKNFEVVAANNGGGDNSTINT